MFFPLFAAISIRAIFAIIGSFLLCLLLTPMVIRQLKLRQFGQVVRVDGVKEHIKKKSGIPTMGGIVILMSILVNSFLWCQWNAFVGLSLFCLLGMGGLGFVDDFTKITKNRSLGLTSRQKLAGQFLFAAIFMIALYNYAPLHSGFLVAEKGEKILIPAGAVGIPYWQYLDLGLLFIPFGIFVIIGASNAVNLTDGLDGLAAGTIIAAALPYLAIAYLTGNIIYAEHLRVIYVPGAGELTILLATVVGAELGFLWYNAHPAEIFMGDTGSLSLGALIGAIAMLTRQEILLAIIGGIFVAEALSVIIQVSYFKTTGQRVFKMAPIHHHFELLGWAESKVVFRFWIIAMMLSLGGLGLFGLRLLLS